MQLSVFTILSFTILIPGCVSLFALADKKTDKTYLPVILCFILGLINEIIIYSISSIHAKAAIGNVYIICEFSFFLWQFYKWGVIKHKQVLLPALILSTILWLLTSFIGADIFERNMLFRVISSFILVILAIETINRSFLTHGVLLFDSKFVICSGIILFYTYNIIVESFIIGKLNLSKEFMINVFQIKSYINALVNIIFAISILCIPRKKKFTSQY